MMSLKITSALALLSLVSASGNYNSYGGAGSGFVAGGGGGYGGSYGDAHNEKVNNGDGNYKYSYETGNGISAHERRSRRAPGPESPAVMSEGGFSYRAPDGQQTYTAADENSFRFSFNIPTAPPIPSIE